MVGIAEPGHVLSDPNGGTTPSTNILPFSRVLQALGRDPGTQL